MRLILVGMVLIGAALLAAEEKPALPDAVQKALTEKLQGVTEYQTREREKHGARLYKIRWLDKEQQQNEVEIAADGKVGKYAKEVKADKLPEAVQQAIAKKYPAAEVTRAQLLEEKEVAAYELELKDGERKLKLSSNLEGELNEPREKGKGAGGKDKGNKNKGGKGQPKPEAAVPQAPPQAPAEF